MDAEDDIDGMQCPPAGRVSDASENTEHEAQPSASAAAAESGTSVSAATQAQPATRPYKYGAETTIDDEVAAMLSAALHEIRRLKPEEFPTRNRKKEDQTLSQRAVPFPKAGVEKIMKAEVILCADLRARPEGKRFGQGSAPSWRKRAEAALAR